MIFSRQLYSWGTLGLTIASVAHAADPGHLGGFMPGGSFEAAQQHALVQEWKLVPLSVNFPGYWTVEGANLSLFVCNGMVSSIVERLEGDLEEFTALVWSMQLESGKPDVQILNLRSGIGDISTIDARFDTDNGGATVQLQSVGGERTFSVRHWIKSDCR